MHFSQYQKYLFWFLPCLLYFLLSNENSSRFCELLLWLASVGSPCTKVYSQCINQFKTILQDVFPKCHTARLYLKPCHWEERLLTKHSWINVQILCCFAKTRHYRMGKSNFFFNSIYRYLILLFPLLANILLYCIIYASYYCNFYYCSSQAFNIYLTEKSYFKMLDSILISLVLLYSIVNERVNSVAFWNKLSEIVHRTQEVILRAFFHKNIYCCRNFVQL